MGVALYINGISKDLRTIRELIKDGSTAEQIAKPFNCSTETLLEALQVKTGVKFKEYKRDLIRNEGRSKRKTTIEIKRKEVGNMSENAEKEKVELIEEETTKSHEEFLIEQVQKQETSIFGLREKLALANEKVIETETAKDATQQEVQVCYKQFQEIQSKLGELQKKFANQVSLLDGRRKEAEELSLKIAQETEKLSRLNQELEMYKTIEVYSDESGLHVSNEDYLPDKETILEIICELADDEKVAQYKFETIKKMAEMKAAITLMEIAGVKYSVSAEKCSEEIKELLQITEESA